MVSCDGRHRAATGHRHRVGEIGLEDVDGALRAAQSSGRYAIDGRASGKAEIGAERSGDDKIGPAPYSAVEEETQGRTDRRPDLRQCIQRGLHAIELVAAVI